MSNTYVFVANLISGEDSLELSSPPEIEVFRRNNCRSDRQRRNSKFSHEIAANHAKRMKSKLLFRNREETTISATITFWVANYIFGAESLDRSEAPEIEVFKRNRCISHRKRRKSRFSSEIVANHAKRLKSIFFLAESRRSNVFDDNLRSASQIKFSERNR